MILMCMLVIMFAAGCKNSKPKVVINQWSWNGKVYHRDLPCDTFYQSKDCYWIYVNDGKKDSLRACWLSTNKE